MSSATTQETILVVDDEEEIRTSLSTLLETDGYDVVGAGDLASARRMVSENPPDAVLLDVWLPDGNGLELLQEIRNRLPSLPVLMISGRADIATAVDALQKGAMDFLEKPLAAERVLASTRNALRMSRLESENRKLREATGLSGPFVAESPIMQKVLQEVAWAAESDAPVLLLGESGTGKERLARFLHDGSRRRAGPFVAVNTTAIPRELTESELFGHERGAFTGATTRRTGRFKTADGGTLFLDEIGDMPAEVQVKLLRTLETGSVEPVGATSPVSVDIRLISATHRDLAKSVEAGEFRLDLYHRLAVVVLRIPPLRDRPEDILALARHFLRQLSRLHGLSPPTLSSPAQEALLDHPWPGNVRELRNLLERVLILRREDVVDGESIQRLLAFNPATPRGPRPHPPLSLEPEPARHATYKERFLSWEKSLLRRILEQESWNVAQTAARLGMDRSHLHRKIRQHGLTRPSNTE
jgi:two-component system nitrogen regulation response regulator NtrX